MEQLDPVRTKPGWRSPEQMDAALRAVEKGEMVEQRDLLIRRWVSQEIDNPDAWNIASSVDEWSPYGDHD